MAEAKAKFTRYEIDLQNKPEWYAPKVNPASKVMCLFYDFHVPHDPDGSPGN